jgi:hypothetical protein
LEVGDTADSEVCATSACANLGVVGLSREIEFRMPGCQ